MLNIPQFSTHVIRPALKALDLYSDAAKELLLGTALQESNLKYLAQVGGGPALGVFQMEPNTHDDIWLNFLAYRSDLSDKVRTLVSEPVSKMLAGNMLYAAAMCRVHYARVKSALPKAGDIEAQAEYWKAHYNTPGGHGTVEQYLANWDRYVK